jgi:hypothetical protein
MRSSPQAWNRSWAFLFIRNALLWLPPATLVWALATPLYNRVLLGAAENLVQVTESPDVTDLLRKDDHFAYISRRDFPPAKSLVYGFRVTDVHFHLVMLAALFLAIPRLSMRRRVKNLGSAVLITVFFDILLIFFHVKLAYTVRLGPWSLVHYSVFARNFWGLGKHLLDLPLKLALPFVLWAGFYLRELIATAPGLAHARPPRDLG